MKIEQALATISRCAVLYEKNLVNMNLLFILNEGNSNRLETLETRFLAHNYLHLTGIETTIKSPNEFYELCLDRRVPLEAIAFKKDGTTKLKLQVLDQLMNIERTARMLGDFRSNRLKLCADKVAGSQHACMCFVNENGYFVPNSSLNEDVRDMVAKAHRVMAVFKKEIHSPQYTTITYLAKGVQVPAVLTALPPSITSKINV